MAITQDWKIRARAHACAHTGKHFVDGEEFFTAILVEPTTGEYVRHDYSQEAWEAIRGQLEPFSFWQSTYQAPAGKAADPNEVRKETAESLLRRLIEENEPHTENARYILAVMLERKKILRPTDTQSTETHRLLFYEHAKTGEVFMILDPELKLSEVESVQEEVAALLNPPKPPTQEAPPQEGAGTSDTDPPEEGAT
ncbi:hypothetical protein BH23VER1_BH23VER1_27560 [soil metagenome]